MKKQEAVKEKEEKSKKKKSEVTKERLLQVALELFQSKGFQETTMRDIAKAAELTPGAAYYHFRGKNEFVLAFYQQTLEASLKKLPELLKKETKLKDRLVSIAEEKFFQMKEFESLVSALVQNASGPKNPLSPFSRENSELREAALEQFEKVIDGSDCKISDPQHKTRVVKLLWFHHMLLIYFWIHDHSENKKSSKKLAAQSSKIISQMLKLSQVKVIKPFLSSIFKQIDIIDDIFEKPH